MSKKAQTLEQRRRNAKFLKEQESRMGKSEDQIKKREKAAPKPTISPFWLGMFSPVDGAAFANHISQAILVLAT